MPTEVGTQGGSGLDELAYTTENFSSILSSHRNAIGVRLVLFIQSLSLSTEGERRRIATYFELDLLQEMGHRIGVFGSVWDMGSAKAGYQLQATRLLTR